MRAGLFLGAVALQLGLALASAQEHPAPTPFRDWAPTPPMGWNSWDCFESAVNEDQVLANADYVAKHLKQHGWDTIVIDSQWARPDPANANKLAGSDLEMDDYGRLLPAPNRFPSSRDSRSFKPLADAIHARGLKFGLHLLRGLPRLAVKRNTPVLGTTLRAADIANTSSTCRWLDDTWGVDTSKPGAQAYYDSVIALMAEWGVDFLKVDDLASPYKKDEVEALRKAIDKCGRPIILSTSAGPIPLEDAAHVAANANMWRIDHDLWDRWPGLHRQFANLADWAALSAQTAGGFPDPDMLPIGTLRLDKPGRHATRLTHPEQITMLTLWSISRSPLFFGGNLPDNDDFTLSLLTNDEVLSVNQHSTENRQLLRAGPRIAWTARAAGSPDLYLALFNAPSPPASRQPATAPAPVTITIPLSDLGFSGTCQVRDLWTHTDLPPVRDSLSTTLPPHAAALYRLRPQPQP